MNIKRCFVKTVAFFYPVTFAVFLFAQYNSVFAATIPVTVVTDKALKLEVTWSGKGLDDGSDNDSLAVPKLTNWLVGPDPLKLTYLGGGDGWEGKLTVQHIVAPHKGEGMGKIAQFLINFDQLSPTNSFAKISVLHDGHKDVYTLNYSYVPKTDTFKAKLIGTHVVPIPAALLLFGSAVASLSLVAGKKRKEGRYVLIS